MVKCNGLNSYSVPKLPAIAKDQALQDLTAAMTHPCPGVLKIVGMTTSIFVLPLSLFIMFELWNVMANSPSLQS